MELLNEKEFISILKSAEIMGKTNNIFKSKNPINLAKAKKIFSELQKNEKLNSFLIERYLEEYVKFIYENREKIKQNIDIDYSDKIGNNNFYINMKDEDFKKTLSRITINDEHLSEDEVKECTMLYSKVLNNPGLHNTISYSILKEYALFIYSNRYQLRMFLNKKLSSLPLDDNGNYILDDKDFISKVNRDGGKNSPLWIYINSSNKENDKFNNILCDVVVKNLFDDNERETSLIAEEIARELGLPVAQYYPAIYVGKEFDKDNTKLENDKYVTNRIVLTPNFLKPGEELITGDRISKYDMDVRTVPNSIREFFEKQGVDNQKIEELITDYRVVMAYNCLINHRDCHNGNWGYVKTEDGDFRIAHIFDLEGSLDENVHNIRAIYVGNHYSSGENNIDNEILKELLKDKKCRERVHTFLDLDMKNVFKNVKISKGINISWPKRKKVMDVINNEKQIIEEVERELDRDEEVR